ncbi:MAG: LytR/AlgR family response regulator transcription factor [Chitinophagales bacterium]
MKINCIAIEDEPLALKKLEGFILQTDYLHLMKTFTNAVDAIGYLKKSAVDLIFLDIRMKKLSGIQFLESLSNPPKVVITTAYDAYALKGYELDVADYLLKPFTFERFLKSAEKVYKQLLSVKQSTVEMDYLFVKTEYRIEKVELKKVLYIQGMKDYLQIHTSEKKIMTLQTFKNLMEILPKKDFQRIHNSYIVSVSKIESIERNRIRIGNEVIPISSGYRSEFYGFLKEMNILI